MPSSSPLAENTDAFWKPWETEIGGFDDALELIHDVFEKWSKGGKQFAWRGQVDASRALHSSLFRRLSWTRGQGQALDEAALQNEESAILEEVHRWGLHTGPSGRLSTLNQLAILQHYGAPTRLIDVTFNPLIGLWFAVEQQWANGVPVNEDKDGRLFAIEVTSRLINKDKTRSGWEDASKTPWTHFETDGEKREWTTQPFVWRPARLDHRIAAQNGGFLLGGVPTSRTQARPLQWRKAPQLSAGHWLIDEVRRAVSVPLQLHQINSNGGQPENPVYTVRIKHSAKEEIRKRLQELYGYEHSTIYPDYSGFALYGRPELRSRKPD